MGKYTFNKSLFDFKNQKFIKLLGTGSKEGFSVFPDFSNYILISAWENDKDREQFIKTHKVISNITDKCYKRTEIKIDPYESKGSWNNSNPFDNKSDYENEKILIITRARVRFKKMLDFLINTSKASRSIKRHDGALFYKGVGEFPIIEQATISIWESEEKMKLYAYNNSEHMKIISKARKRKWYSEELFVRCNILHIKTFNV
jgi:heme-degrading monooxygenase HmoA